MWNSILRYLQDAPRNVLTIKCARLPSEGGQLGVVYLQKSLCKGPYLPRVHRYRVGIGKNGRYEWSEGFVGRGSNWRARRHWRESETWNRNKGSSYRHWRRWCLFQWWISRDNCRWRCGHCIDSSLISGRAIRNTGYFGDSGRSWAWLVPSHGAYPQSRTRAGQNRLRCLLRRFWTISRQTNVLPTVMGVCVCLVKANEREKKDVCWNEGRSKRKERKRHR